MSKALMVSQKLIENRIYTVRGNQVMVDYHLAELYEVETKRINEQVKRNNKRFPIGFMYQLTASEWKQLQSQIATTENNSGLQSQIATAKHLAASLKDLGKKWFAFSKMDKHSVQNILNSILELL